MDRQKSTAKSAVIRQYAKCMVILTNNDAVFIQKISTLTNE